MASRILGVDLGAYSVKVVAVNPGFRNASVMEVEEVLVPEGEDPDHVRAVRAMGELVRERQMTKDSAFFAVPGDKLFIHVLEFSFPSLKRSELERVIGSELEDVLPIDLEDMVFAFDTIPGSVAVEAPAATDDDVMDLGAPITDDDPTNVQSAPSSDVVRGRVASPASGMRVLTCAMRRDQATELVVSSEMQGVEARGLIASPMSYLRVAERVAGLVQDRAKDPPVAVIDIGHRRTDVFVFKDGHAVFARSIPRGGHDVTSAISRTWRLSYEEAEKAKHTDGFIASSVEPASSEAWARVHEVVVGEVGPLARDLKQTLSACRAKTGAVVARALVVGGGSRLRGVAGFLADKLRIPCTTLSTEDDVAILGEKVAGAGARADVAFAAAGVAFEGASGRARFDLRQGSLAFKADLSFLREKAGKLAAAALVIIAFAVINGFAALNKLNKSEKVLKARLQKETIAEFGTSLNASQALKMVSSEAGDLTDGDSPMPKMTAYDLLLDINTRMPPPKDVKLDITEIEIKPGRISLKAITGTTEKYDAVKASAEVIKALKGQTCFEDVSRGNISSGPDETKNFPVTIKATCR